MPPNEKMFTTTLRGKKEIKKTIDMIDRKKNTIAFTDCYRMHPGDPFTHPDIFELIAYTRKKYPDKEIYIENTAGIDFNELTINFLNDIGVSLNLSLNSTQEPYCSLWMRHKAKNLNKTIKLLGKAKNIKFGFTLVAMAQFSPWSDIKKTLLRLDAHHPMQITIFTYSYTDYGSLKPKKADPHFFHDFTDFVNQLRNEIKAFIFLYPVVKNSAPFAQGLFEGYLCKIKSLYPLVKHRKILAPVSEAIYDIASEKLKQFRNIKVKKIKNKSFGGSIIVSGLLTVKDYISSLKREKDSDLILLPYRPFNRGGFDLFGRHATEIGHALNKQIIILKCKETWFNYAPPDPRI